MDFLNSLSSLSDAMNETISVPGPNGWEVAGSILGALGALAIFAFFAYFKKDGEKRKIVDDLKNFSLFKANFAEDLASIIYYYLSIKVVFASCKNFGTSYGFWYFLVELVGQLVWYRFVYEVVKAILAFVKKK